MQRVDRILIAVVLLVLAVPASAQTQARRDSAALLAVECEPAKGGCSVQHLVKYEFQQGRVSRDVILTRPTNKVSYGFGQNHLHRGRYLITNWGDVVDIQKKRLVHEGVGDYVGVEGDRVIERVDRRNLHGYFYYDIKSGKAARLKSPGKWALPGVLAPNQIQSVFSDPGTGKLWFHSLNGKKRLLTSGLMASVTGCSFFTVPIFWLSNDLVLTQRNDGELITVDMQGRVSPVLTIPSKPSEYGYTPELERNDAGQIIYRFIGGTFAIDVDSRQYSRVDTSWTDLGSGFHWEQSNADSGRLIRFQQKDIGRWWVLSTATTDGFIAVEYGDVGYLFGKPKGFKVWSESSNEWVTVDPNWLVRLIGWIDM